MKKMGGRNIAVEYHCDFTNVNMCSVIYDVIDPYLSFPYISRTAIAVTRL